MTDTMTLEQVRQYLESRRREHLFSTLDPVDTELNRRAIDAINAVLKAQAEPVAEVPRGTVPTSVVTWLAPMPPPGTKLYTRPPAQTQDARDAARVCGWTEDDEGNWDTGCGHLFVLNDGTPSDNEMGFCCFCGGKLEQETVIDAAMAQEAQP